MTTRRFWLHIPAGIIFALTAYAHWIYPPCCVALFIFYEKNEDRWIKDQAWKDTIGALVGLIAGSVIYWMFEGGMT